MPDRARTKDEIPDKGFTLSWPETVGEALKGRWWQAHDLAGKGGMNGHNR